jgi:hypothetical protein
MLRVGFEPTIPVLKWAMTLRNLHRAATVFGFKAYYGHVFMAP